MMKYKVFFFLLGILYDMVIVGVLVVYMFKFG